MLDKNPVKSSPSAAGAFWVLSTGFKPFAFIIDGGAPKLTGGGGGAAGAGGGGGGANKNQHTCCNFDRKL